jgi:hypothetical protein
MRLISAFVFGLLGAVLYRWRGHASEYKKYLPRPFNQIAFSIPYAYFAYLLCPYSIGVSLFIASIVLVLTTLALVTGHGNAMDMGQAPRGEDETLEFTVKWIHGIHGKIPECLYDFILMMVLGIAVTLPCGIATLNPFIALSGALKAPAYAIGHIMFKLSPTRLKVDGAENTYYGIKFLPRHLDVATEIGEFLTGFFLWGCLFLLV